MTDKEKLERKIARSIKKQVSWFNGWHADEGSEWNSCLRAAKNVLKIINKTKTSHIPKWKCPSCFGTGGVDRIKKDFICKDCGKKIGNQDAIDHGVFW